MNEIIMLNQENSRFPVSARELYEKLGFDPSNWVRWYKENIVGDDGTIKGTDWEDSKPASDELYVIKTKNPSHRPSKDFNLSIDFAKHLCMLARTDRGREVRNYFIDVEKRHRMQLESSFHRDVAKIAKEKRVNFTGILKDHGCIAKHHYINITKGMKQTLGIDPKKKKPDCETLELMKIAVSEDLAALGIMVNDSQGYYECRDVSKDAAGMVREISAKGNLKLAFSSATANT